MALMTGKEYEESLKKMKMRIFLFGEEIQTAVGNPILQPAINSVKATYDLAQMPEYEDLMTATSNLTGEKINRFTHIHQSASDLVKKVKMRVCSDRRLRPASSAVLAWMLSMQCTAQLMKWTRNAAPIIMRISENLQLMSRKMTLLSMAR